MNYIQTTITMSNEGAHLLQAGQTLAALRLLRQAVQAVKDVSSLSRNAFGFDLSKTVAQVPSSGHEDCFLPEDDRQALSSGLVYMHTRPLIIPSHHVLSSRDDLDSFLHELSMYTIFNLALACHCFGIESGMNAPLERATELYHAVAQTPRFPSRAVALVQCLALNNLAHVHYEQCAYDASQYCMLCMHDLIGQTFCLDSATDIMCEREVEEIKLNVMYLRPPSAAQAA